LDKGLPGLVSEARALGYLVKVDTNGMHPEALKSIDADFVSIDIKADPRKYHGLIPGSPVNAAERLIQSIEAVRGRKIDHEFRTTLAPGIVDGRDIAAIGALVKPGESWILQRFRPGRTLDPLFTDRLPYDERQYGSMAEAARFFTEAARLR
jgi:pyruvate formate lyase activating enzyme